MAIRDTILDLMVTIAQQQKKTLAPLSDDLALLDTGLDSLCIAILVAGLDDELGLDPLSAPGERRFPVTVGDFIRLYEDAAT